MKNRKRYQNFLYGLGKSICGLAFLIAAYGANSASAFFVHQRKFPQSAKGLRKL